MHTKVVDSTPPRAAMFVTFVVPPGHEQGARAILANASELWKSVNFRRPEDDLSFAAGIGADLWQRMIDLPMPRDLHVLPVFRGAKHQSVSTPGDIFFHVRSEFPDDCFEFVWLLKRQFGAHAIVVDEVHGFRYYDDRDFLGFVDGSANPRGDDALASALVQPDRDPDYAGGSYLIVQKYIHDMDAWHSISVEEQERVIGRYKLNDVEIPDDLKATNSHVALNTITEADGTEHEIVRSNLPFGSVQDNEFGTYFISYSGNAYVTERMLQNMFIGRPEGHYDRILDFSTAKTGNLFYVPTMDFLDGLADLPLPASATAQPDAEDIPPTPGHATDTAMLGAPDRSGAPAAITTPAEIGLDGSVPRLGTPVAAPTDAAAAPEDQDDAPDSQDTDETEGSAPDDADFATTDHSLRIGSLRSPRR